jgi:putative ABC transport system substrate-binding protein
VDKIRKGTQPADLPVKAPTKFEFVIRFKTTKRIKLTIPPNVLVRTDKVIPLKTDGEVSSFACEGASLQV